MSNGKPETKPEAGTAKIPVNSIVIFLVMFFVIGCNDVVKEKNNEAWDACLESGGVPIMSKWSTQLDDCLYE